MHERRDDDRGRSRHEHGQEEQRCGHREGRGHDGCSHGEHEHRECRDRRGREADTRFLQLEMSQVLYAEAEAVTRPAFRELLFEAAKARLRERFGDRITGLAELAVDELLNDVLSSLEIEARIHERTQERSRTKDRLREIFRGAGREGRDTREAPAGGEGGGDDGDKD